MRVFLSHVAEEGPLAKELAAQLAEQGLQVWDPELEILPGDSWAKGVSEALETSDAMVVLFSPEYARSSYARSEVEYAPRQPPLSQPPGSCRRRLAGRGTLGLPEVPDHSVPGRRCAGRGAHRSGIAERRARLEEGAAWRKRCGGNDRRYHDRIVPLYYKTCDHSALSWVLDSIQRIEFRRRHGDGFRELLRIWGVGYRGD